MVFEPCAKTEYFLNVGVGFHSNDARGAEIGLRAAIIPHWQLAASLWILHLDSELLFVSEGGTTEPSRESRRTGVELSAYYTPVASLGVAVNHPLGWFSGARSRYLAPVADIHFHRVEPRTLRASLTL